MTRITVAVSTVADGTMYWRPTPADPEILKNREHWFKKEGVRAEDATRVQLDYNTEVFCRYQEVGESDKGRGMEADEGPYVDALVTKTPGHVLFLPVADCIAVTIFDPEHRVLMLSHLGRHSLEQNGAVKSVQYLAAQYGSDPSALHVWASPAVGKETYPIHKLNGIGMKEALFWQLEEAGIAPEHIYDNPANTATDERYFSHSEFKKGNKPSDGRQAMIAVFE